MPDDDSILTQTVDDFPERQLVNPDTKYRFDLNKKGFRVRIPREEETEERVVVYIEPVE